MYKIEKVKVDGFWQRFSVEGTFNKDVNIIIGKNGSGKTTFMNILHAVLDVDMEELCQAEFNYVEIILLNGKSRRKVTAEIIDDNKVRFPKIKYKISTSVFELILVNPEDRRVSPIARNKAHQERNQLKAYLSDMVNISSLSVHRLRGGYETDRSRGDNALSAVDYRLKQMLSDLTKYQLELAQKCNSVSNELQKSVLSSMLYSKKDKTSLMMDAGEFDKDVERAHLNRAFRRLGAYDSKIKERINEHVDGISDTAIRFNRLKKRQKNGEALEDVGHLDFDAFTALSKARKIIHLSLEAEEKIEVINRPILLLTEMLTDFIDDKSFSLRAADDLSITKDSEIVDVNLLSSGEKQLLILFIEALLQREQNVIFLTDEPELSLHISWQRKIIPAVKKLNPNAQVIVATHSPEVASGYRESIINMGKMIHG